LLFAGELVLVFSASVALYMSTLTGILGASYDSASYTNSIESGFLFHPQRLLFHFVCSMWLIGWRSVGVSALSFRIISALNAVFGALILCVFYSFLRRRLLLGRLIAGIGTALPAFSFGFWFLSTCVEVDVIPLFFTALSFYLIRSSRATEKTFALVGITHGMAILFHQAQCLLLPAILLSTFLTRKRAALPVWRSLGWYALTIVPIVAIPYGIVIHGVEKINSVKEAWYWVTLYAQVPSHWYPLSFSTAKIVLR